MWRRSPASADGDALKGRIRVVGVKAGGDPEVVEAGKDGRAGDQHGWHSLETILWAAVRASVLLIFCFIALWIVMTAIGALSSYPPAFYWVMVALACTALLSLLVIYACYSRPCSFE